MKLRSSMLALVIASILPACFGSSGPFVRATHDPVTVEVAVVESDSPVETGFDAAVAPTDAAAGEAHAVAARPSTEEAAHASKPDEPSNSGESQVATAAVAPTSPKVSERGSVAAPRSEPTVEPATGAATAIPASTTPALVPGAQAGAVLRDPNKAHAPSDPNAPFLLSDHGLPSMQIPRDEKLVYDVILNLGVISPDVGKVTITSKVEPFRASPLLLASADPATHAEQAVVSARAEGQYAVYTLDELITTAHLPQAFPALLHRSTQSGSENRKREMTLGEKDGKFVCVYRRDTHCKKCNLKTHFVEPTWAWQDAHHCEGCKRVEHRLWKDPVTRDAPSGCVDMLSAVYVARTMILEGRETVEFQLMDRDELWDVKLKRGKSTKRIEVPAGEFDAFEITLQTGVPKSETGRDEADFSGLFGIHGELSIWVEATTGVPVWIRGLVPVGPIELDVGVELAGFRGTPRAFKPIE
ncbi:MAG: DUF3108 domain-containing protein [Planctomycetes bacterium]|nr:DUF3108 domain-containing protein [Planctomycetota bacterium]